MINVNNDTYEFTWYTRNKGNLCPECFATLLAQNVYIEGEYVRADILNQGIDARKVGLTLCQSLVMTLKSHRQNLICGMCSEKRCLSCPVFFREAGSAPSECGVLGGAVNVCCA